MHRSTIWRAAKRAAARAAEYVTTTGWTQGVMWSHPTNGRAIGSVRAAKEVGACACLYGAAVIAAEEEAEKQGYAPGSADAIASTIVRIASNNLGKSAIVWNDTEAKSADEVAAELCKVAGSAAA